MIVHDLTDKASNKKTTQYYCIPHSKSKKAIWDKALAKIHATNDVALLKTFTWALMNYSAQLSK